MASPSEPSAPHQPGSLPFPDTPAGTPNDEMPFDHIMVVMMENHSFDNLLGDLGRTRGDLDALTFDGAGHATNSNPSPAPATPITAFPVANTAQAKNVTQGWAATHEQINGGAMDGFVRAARGQREPMAYYTPEVLPFAYSLASTFTLANRWFSSIPGPTYPNRRFLLAGTAFGGTATNKDELLAALENRRRMARSSTGSRTTGSAGGTIRRTSTRQKTQTPAVSQTGSGRPASGKTPKSHQQSPRGSKRPKRQTRGKH
jgi:phospholipase C